MTLSGRAVWAPLLCLLLGCGPTLGGRGSRRSSPGALPSLGLPHLDERALLLLLVDRQMIEPFTVWRTLEGPAVVRQALAVALGRVGDRQGREVLEGLLADSVATVRRAAVFALGEIEAATAVDALLRVLDHPDRQTGALAVEALGKLGAPLEEVARRLERLDADEGGARLLPHLFRYTGEGVRHLAVQGLAVGDAALRPWAAYALSYRPQVESLPLLRRLLEDSDPWIRGQAARALGQIGEGHDLERLRPLLEDTAAGPVIEALGAAAAMVESGRAAPPRAWLPSLEELIQDPRRRVRVTALETCWPWLRQEGFELAVARRAVEGDVWERGTALIALARARSRDARRLALLAARDPRPRLRAAAARAAGHLAAGEVLAHLAADPEARVREAVLRSRLLAEGDAVPAVREGLADSDPGVHAAVLEWLVLHPVLPFEEVARVLAADRLARVIEARLYAVRALVARALDEPLERGSVVELLEELATDARDYLLRREAVEGLRRLARPAPEVGPVAVSRGVDTYRQILQQTAAPRWAEIVTAQGTVRLRLQCPQAPMTCLNFLQLAAQRFYDGLTFHRVVPGFVVQGGDPRGDGWGGPGYTLRDEINRIRYDRGVVGMAAAGPDTAGSQFFVTLAPQPQLDGVYTAFGQVVEGFEILERIAAGETILAVREVR